MFRVVRFLDKCEGLLVAGFVRSSRRQTPPTTMFFKQKFGGPIKKDCSFGLNIGERLETCCLPRTTMQSMAHRIMVGRWVHVGSVAVHINFGFEADWKGICRPIQNGWFFLDMSTAQWTLSSACLPRTMLCWSASVTIWYAFLSPMNFGLNWSGDMGPWVQEPGGIQRSSRLGFPKAGRQRVIPKLSGASWEHRVCKDMENIGSPFESFLVWMWVCEILSVFVACRYIIVDWHASNWRRHRESFNVILEGTERIWWETLQRSSFDWVGLRPLVLGQRPLGLWVSVLMMLMHVSTSNLCSHVPCLSAGQHETFLPRVAFGATNQPRGFGFTIAHIPQTFRMDWKLFTIWLVSVRKSCEALTHFVDRMILLAKRGDDLSRREAGEWIYDEILVCKHLPPHFQRF